MRKGINKPKLNIKKDMRRTRDRKRKEIDYIQTRTLLGTLINLCRKEIKK